MKNKVNSGIIILHTYGTTLKGLQIHNKVDTDEYLAYVHNVPLENLYQTQSTDEADAE